MLLCMFRKVDILCIIHIFDSHNSKRTINQDFLPRSPSHQIKDSKMGYEHLAFLLFMWCGGGGQNPSVPELWNKWRDLGLSAVQAWILLSGFPHLDFFYRMGGSIRDAVTSRTLKKMVAQATIYSIWTERNNRLHVGESRSPATIFMFIDHFIKDVILGKRKLKKFQLLMQLWIRYEWLLRAHWMLA